MDQIKKIADSITEFNFTNPVLIDENNALLAVHGKKIAKWVTRVLSNAQGTKIHIIMATSVAAKLEEQVLGK